MLRYKLSRGEICVANFIPLRMMLIWVFISKLKTLSLRTKDLKNSLTPFKGECIFLNLLPPYSLCSQGIMEIYSLHCTFSVFVYALCVQWIILWYWLRYRLHPPPHRSVSTSNLCGIFWLANMVVRVKILFFNLFFIFPCYQLRDKLV